MESGEAFPEIGGYTVSARLGAGGSGTVYLAVQEALGRQVALKIITGAHATSLSRFHREAAAMAQLTHPGLVRLYDHGMVGAAPYIVMEYVSGGSLHDRLKTGKGHGSSAALRLARELLAVLGVMHDAGLLHRDVKPSNILLRENGSAVLADLGLVRQDDPALTRITRDGQMLGTVTYLAPEVYANGELTRATDLFALGAVLFEVLTGQPASRLEQFSPEYQPPDPTTFVPDCPDQLRDLVMDLLARDPLRRPESAAAALRRLRECRSRRVTMSGAMHARGSRGLVARGVVGACLLALGLGLVARFGPWSQPDPLASLRAAPTEVSVDLVPHGSELSVSVFDAGGRPAGSRIAPPGGRTSVVIGGLAPGARYTLSVFRPGAEARLLSRREFATAGQVRVLGVEPGPTPVLWISANPAMTFKAGATSVQLGATPVGVPLGRERGPFQLVRPGQPPVTLAIPLPEPDADSDSMLGVTVPPTRDFVIRELSGEKRPLVEWVQRHDLRHVSLLPGPQGRPVLSADLLASFSRGGRTALTARVHPGAAGQPGSAGWESQLDAPELFGIKPLALGLRFDWLIESVGVSSGDGTRTGMAELQKPWGPYLAEHHKRWHFAHAAQVRDMMSVIAPGGPGFAPHDIEEMNIPLDGDLMRPWIEWTPEAVAKYRAGRLDANVRSVTIDYEREDDYSESDGARANLAVIRQFVIARRFFPGAPVTFDLCPRLVKRDGTLRPVWAGLEAIARSLRGVDSVSALSAQAQSIPSLVADTLTFAIAFGAGSRRLQVFFADNRAVPATFRPARPGLLRTVVPPSCEPGPPRFVDGTAPITFQLTNAPSIYEELVPTGAASGDEARVVVVP